MERLTRQLLVDAFDLVHHAARLDDGDPALVAALAFAHSRLGRLLGDRLVREDANVDLAATLDVAGHGDTSGLDLARRDPAALERLEAEIAEGDRVAALGAPAHAVLLRLAEFGSLRGHHGCTYPLR